MANAAITADVAVTAAVFADAMAEDLWDATTKGNFTARFLRWKDKMDAVAVALQGRVATDSTAALTASTIVADSLTADTVDAGALAISDAAEVMDDTDFAVSAQWGSSSVVDTDSTDGSTIALFYFSVTAGASPTAAPQTVTVTWPTALAAAPKGAFVQMRELDGTITNFLVTTLSTTQCVLTTVGDPTALGTVAATVLVVF